MKSSGRVDDEPGVTATRRLAEGCLGDGDRVIARGFDTRNIDALGQRCELRTRGRPVDVRAHEQHTLLTAPGQKLRKLRRRRRLTSALQPDE